MCCDGIVIKKSFFYCFLSILLKDVVKNKLFLNNKNKHFKYISKDFSYFSLIFIPVVHHFLTKFQQHHYIIRKTPFSFQI